MTTHEDMLIQKEYDALIEEYLNSNHRKKVDIIQKAFEFSKKAHQGIKRKSGEPYILHPLAVARIVCQEIGLGSTSIVASLLHDVVEDTEYTVDDIKNLFGERIANIVSGLTKLSSGMFGEDVSLQAENFRKLLLTMSEDIRVILIKIADRLHNMRTLGSMPPAKQYKISGETIYIYAPLAHRLGLFAIKTELEELSFKWENPDAYKEISLKLKQSMEHLSGNYQIFAKPIIDKLNTLGFSYEIRKRQKSVYSIWNKMQSKNIPFEEVYDLFAVRIIFENEVDIDEKKRCWDIYSVITDLYKLKPDRIRDWVNRPKSNGYQALHLTVMGPAGNWVEVQIRSRKMDDIAEKGFAAHWKYKAGGVEEDTELNKWLKTIKEILENPSPNALDFMDTIKLNLFAQEIFVFTPAGELKTLAQGSSVLDFAYTIHTKIGNHAIGAKVNHQLVPISHILKSGDQVEVLTSKTAYPQEEWLNFVFTAKAKSKIDIALKKKYRQFVTIGEEYLESTLEMANIELTPSLITSILDYYKISSKDELFHGLATNRLKLPSKIQSLIQAKKDGQSNVLVKYIKHFFNATLRQSSSDSADSHHLNPVIDRKKTYILNAESFKQNFRVAQCCKPIAGDKVFGYVDNNNYVDVHSIHCAEGLRIKASQGDRIIDLVWSESTYPFPSKIKFSGIDRKGIVKDVAERLNNMNVVITKFFCESNDGIFKGYVIVNVDNVNTIKKIIKNLQRINNIDSVNRVKDN